MSRSMALEVASRNITINCVAPGFIETDMTKDLLAKNEENLKKYSYGKSWVFLKKLLA